MAGSPPAAAASARDSGMPVLPGDGAALSIGLSAVIVAASVQEPRVLTIKLAAGATPSHPQPDRPAAGVEALPSGPLEAEHRTLEIGLRSWVERQTSQS